MAADLDKTVMGKKFWLIVPSLLIVCIVLVAGAVDDKTAVSSGSKNLPKKGIVIKVPGSSTMATSGSNLKPKIHKIGRPRQFWLDQLQIESHPNRNYASSATYQSPSRGIQGYGMSTLVAVSLVSAFLGAITYAAFDGRGQGTGRSVSEGVFSVLNLIDPEAVVKILTSMEWGDKQDLLRSPTYGGYGTNSSSSLKRSRLARESKSDNNAGAIMKWYQAYRKDPVEMRCVHKLICENLITSSCAAKTVHPDFDGTVLTLVKYLMGSVGVSEIITETVGNPRLCKEIFIPYDLCTYSDGEKKPVTTGEQPATTVPAFNASSIVPRVKYA